MIERSFDVERMNYLINHPSIRPFVGGDPETELDISALVENKDNHMLLGEHGGVAATWTAPDTYEVHTFVLPEGRKGWALEFVLKCRNYLEELGTEQIWTRVPRDADNVRKFTLAAGFKPCGEQTLDLGVGPVLYDLFNWRRKCL